MIQFMAADRGADAGKAAFWTIAVLLLVAMIHPLSLSSVAADERPSTEYEIVEGAILVFGHRLVPYQPLPETGDCDDCGPFHRVSFHRSPDERWVLIVSDVHLANFDAWVFDTRSDAAPIRLLDARRGRHHAETKWHSARVFELFFGGMGYSRSVLFDAANPGEPRVVENPLHIDVERDVYVRYLRDTEAATDEIEIGRLFALRGEPQRFRIALDNEYLSESRFMIEAVEIEGANLVVTYKTTANGLVRAVFSPGVLAGAE